MTVLINSMTKMDETEQPADVRNFNARPQRLEIADRPDQQRAENRNAPQAGDEQSDVS